LKATLGLEDEAGFTLVSPVKRTWSRRGQTPIFRTRIDHRDRLNILGIQLASHKGKKIRLSVSNSRYENYIWVLLAWIAKSKPTSQDLAILRSHNGNCCLSVKSYWNTITGLEVIAFLKQILRLVRGHIIIVWDRHPIHRRARVKEFIQTQKRLHVFEFPVAAPELNPAEYIWTQTKAYTAGTAPHDTYELQSNVFAGVSRTRISQKRLFACLRNSKINWTD
jgi:transposase